MKFYLILLWKRDMLQCCATHCHTGYNVRQPPNHVDTHAVLPTAHRKREHSEFMVPLKKVQRLDYPESFCQNHHKRILSILTRFNGLWALLNLFIALRILLTIPVTVASGERSFSKLKLIKTYLRSTMHQQRLNNLALLSIESPICRDINFETVLKNFAEKKARKVRF